MAEAELVTLAHGVRRLHTAARDERWLVRPSAPVLYFGDLDAFSRSPLRVATVALNPSRREFPQHAPFSRFPGADSTDDREYLASLSRYFTVAPYASWFNFYEEALQGMGASYYGGENVAVHTDVGSVLPTDPTWSGLGAAERDRLSRDGVPIWHRLIDLIEPQVLLWSTARAWLDLIRMEPASDWTLIVSFPFTQSGAPRSRPIDVSGRWYHLGVNVRMLVAFVPASQKPMAGLSHTQKRAAGAAIRAFYDHAVWR